MRAWAWLALGVGSLLLAGCAHTVVRIEERRDRPVEHSTLTHAPRTWQATLAPRDGGATLSLWTHAICTKRMVVTVKCTRVEEERGRRVATPQPDASEELGRSTGPCDRHVAPRAKLTVSGPPDADAVAVETDDDGAATLPFAPSAVTRVVVDGGALVPTTVEGGPPAPPPVGAR
ncbi:MAG: hypothetical protein IT374_15400 [Polyangiaceae bacterium]|nr:hypothetical protein [Polyangiaceae bacterium]